MICIYYQEIDNQFDISAIIRPFQVWDSNTQSTALNLTLATRRRTQALWINIHPKILRTGSGWQVLQYQRTWKTWARTYCTGLNDYKKADTNGTREDILAIIYTKNIVN